MKIQRGNIYQGDNLYFMPDECIAVFFLESI